MTASARNTAIPTHVPACGFFPGPFAVMCGLGAAAVGPGVALLADDAVEDGLCVAVAVTPGTRNMVPTQSTCQD